MRAAKYCVTKVEVLLNRSGPEPAANAVSSLVEYSGAEITSYCTLMSGLAFSKSTMMALSMGTRGGCSCIHIRTVTCSATAVPAQTTRPMMVARRVRSRIVDSSPVLGCCRGPLCMWTVASDDRHCKKGPLIARRRQQDQRSLRYSVDDRGMRVCRKTSG